MPTFAQRRRAGLSLLYTLISRAALIYLLTFWISNIFGLLMAIGVLSAIVFLVLGVGENNLSYSEIDYDKNKFYIVEEGEGKWYIVATRWPFHWRRKLGRWRGTHNDTIEAWTFSSEKEAKEAFARYAKEQNASKRQKQKFTFIPIGQEKVENNTEHLLSLLRSQISGNPELEKKFEHIFAMDKICKKDK